MVKHRLIQKSDLKSLYDKSYEIGYKKRRRNLINAIIKHNCCISKIEDNSVNLRHQYSGYKKDHNHENIMNIYCEKGKFDGEKAYEDTLTGCKVIRIFLYTFLYLGFMAIFHALSSYLIPFMGIGAFIIVIVDTIMIIIAALYIISVFIDNYRNNKYLKDYKKYLLKEVTNISNFHDSSSDEDEDDKDEVIIDTERLIESN